LRAYFIAERRRTLGIHGDETSDWAAAERELLEELKAK
jgi:8-oxo-dGTP pyrophosphatase MutT (NUDIX family)